MARGYKGWFGRKLNDTRLWLAFCAVFLIALVDWRRHPHAAHARSRRAALVLGLALVLRARARVLGRAPAVPADGLPDRAARPGSGCAPRPQPMRTGRLPPVGAGGAARVPDRLPPRPERVRRDGDRRRLCGHGGRRPGAARPAAVRHVPGLERRALRAASTPTAPRAPTARPQEDDRCESPVANGDTYGPVNYAAYVPAVAVTGWTGRWDDLPASHGTSAIFDLACVAGMAASAGASAACGSALVCALAWVAYPFTGLRAAGEHERHDRRGVRDLGVRVRGLAGAARHPAGARRLDEVRAARAVAALEPLSARRGAPPHSFLRGVAGLALGTRARRAAAAARRTRRAARVLGPHVRVPDRARTRRSRSGRGGSTPGCPTSAACRSPRGAARDVRGRTRVPAAATRRRSARRALGSPRPGLRARADALVVPLPALGVPVRAPRARAALAGAP